MKKLTDIFDYNTSSALGWTLIHSIWQGLAILLIFSILRYFFKPSNHRYYLGVGALGLQFFGAIITFSIIYQPASAPEILAENNINLTNFLTQTSNLNFKPTQLSFLQKIEFFLQSNLDLFVVFWLIGMSLLLMRLMLGFVYVHQLKTQQNTSVSADIQRLMNTLIEKIQLPVSVKLLESTIAKVPMTIGWIKPIVLLPVGMATGLTIKQLEAILAHELAHIKRYDYLVNIFQNVVEILFFFHPATWFISAKVRDERENCCDDFAVEICGDRLVLAHALTQVASYQQQPHLVMAFGAKRQTFMDRIKRIIGINDSKPMSYGNWTAVLGMILVVAFGVVYAQKEVVKNDILLKKNEINESKVDIYKLEIQSSSGRKKNLIVTKDASGEVLKIVSTGGNPSPSEEKLFDEFVVRIKEGKEKPVALNINKDDIDEFLNDNFKDLLKNNYENISKSDSTSLEEVEAEMERLGKEMEVYGKKMEVYGKLMEENYGKQMEKHGAEIEKIQRKFMIPQKKIQELSIEMQEASLAMQKLEMKYEDGKMPAEIKQKIADLQKKERELEKQMQVYEQEMQKIEAEMRPFEQKMSNLQSPMDSLSHLMERYHKPMDSLGKIMEEKGKILEKLAKEDETRFKKEMKDFAQFLLNEKLIKDKNDFEIRLKGDKMLIDLQPVPANAYDKVYNWLNTHWSKRVNLKEKDISITVKGDHININSHNDRGSYNYSTGFNSPPLPALAPVAPMPRMSNPSVPTAAPQAAPRAALAPMAPIPSASYQRVPAPPSPVRPSDH